MRRLPPLNAARAFEAAFRHMSFARAAAELNVSPAAVSRHVRDLEIRLGLSLFRRGHSGIAPTEEGRQYGASLADIFDRLEAATAEAAPARRPLRITIEQVFAQRWLIRHLGDFRARHPGIVLDLTPTDRLVDLAAEKVDLGIRYGQGNWPEVEAERLVPCTAYPVAHPHLAAQLPARPGPDDLRRFPLLHEEAGLWDRWFEFAGGGKRQPLPPAAMLLHDIDLALKAAVMGQGIALSDDVIDGEELAAGRLVRLSPIGLEIGAYWLVNPRRKRPGVAARAFRDWLVAALAATGAAPGP